MREIWDFSFNFRLIIIAVQTVRDCHYHGTCALVRGGCFTPGKNQQDYERDAQYIGPSVVKFMQIIFINIKR